MNRIHLVAGAVVLSMLASPLTAGAQGAGARDAERWHDVAARLEPAALVTVRLKDGTRFKGTVIGVEDESMAVLPRTRIPVAARDVRFDDLVSLERAKQGLNPGTKVLIGTGSIVGGLLMMVAIALAGYD
ncbi:MAG TPA: hypothetical protein VM032_11345 [Vicinamibacterales bacterium]|nr:hypothetical protein [Vicinamibacterales bacterium]